MDAELMIRKLDKAARLTFGGDSDHHDALALIAEVIAALSATPQADGVPAEAVFFVEDDFGLWKKTSEHNYRWWAERSGSQDKALKLYTSPQAAQVPEGVERDAARYRWLRDEAGDEWTVCQEVGQDLTAVYLGGDELDDAIDDAAQAQGVGHD